MNWSDLATGLRSVLPTNGQVPLSALRGLANPFLPSSDLHDQITSYSNQIQLEAAEHNADAVRTQANALAVLPKVPPTIALYAEEIVKAVSGPTPDFVAVASICGLVNAQNNTQTQGHLLTGSLQAISEHLQGPQYLRARFRR